MIELGIVDLSAEGRRRLSTLVERWAWAPPGGKVSAPRISLHLLSPEEVRFHGDLDVCIIGPELVGCDAAFINSLRKQLPEKILLCVLDARTYSFGLVEQLGRLGVDDVLVDSASSDEFFRRILLLQRRVQSKKRGRLVVIDSARGGVGKTFITAAVAEGWFEKGCKVCMVDCDVLSQDLTRFMQVRPYVNESLRILIDQERVVTSETVTECVRDVWINESGFGCVAPPAGCDESLFASQHAQRGFVAVLEALLLQYDRVVVDTSSLVTPARNALFQICDDVHFVVNRDASAAYANRQALSLIAGFLKPNATLTTVLNDTGVGSAAVSLLREQVVVIAGKDVSDIVVPKTQQAVTWMCSGHTPYKFLRRNLEHLFIDPGGKERTRSLFSQLVGFVSGVVLGLVRHLAGVLQVGRRYRKRESASKEPWGASPQLGSPALLSSQLDVSDDSALVSKPVLLG
jgi:MinD-like ATPase involved in chromosome partitioning or flagellar assembly